MICTDRCNLPSCAIRRVRNLLPIRGNNHVLLRLALLPQINGQPHLHVTCLAGPPVNKPPAALPGSGRASAGSMQDAPVGPSDPGFGAAGSGSGGSGAAAPSSENAVVLASHVDMSTDVTPGAAAALAGPNLVELQAQV